MIAAPAYAPARWIAPLRSFDALVADVASDIACLAPAAHANRIAHELAMAERTGIRWVWIHGLWHHVAGVWRLEERGT